MSFAASGCRSFRWGGSPREREGWFVAVLHCSAFSSFLLHHWRSTEQSWPPAVECRSFDNDAHDRVNGGAFSLARPLRNMRSASIRPIVALLLRKVERLATPCRVFFYLQIPRKLLLATLLSQLAVPMAHSAHVFACDSPSGLHLLGFGPGVFFPNPCLPGCPTANFAAPGEVSGSSLERVTLATFRDFRLLGHPLCHSLYFQVAVRPEPHHNLVAKSAYRRRNPELVQSEHIASMFAQRWLCQLLSVPGMLGATGGQGELRWSVSVVASFSSFSSR